ncbi:hypothetical protein Emed_002844 [Eimeria media]
MEQEELVGSTPIAIPDGRLFSAEELVIPPDCAPHVKGVLISGNTIRDRVEKMAYDIRNYYKQGELHIVCLLKGARVFFGDLVAALNKQDSLCLALQIKTKELLRTSPNMGSSLASGGKGLDVFHHFVYISTYRNDSASGEVKHIAEELHCLKGKDVLVLDDIVERGNTLTYTKNWLKTFQPKSIRTACLLQVRIKEEVPKVNFVGFTGPVEWFVGYGIDYNDRFRGVPHICVLSDSGKKAFAV